MGEGAIVNDGAAGDKGGIRLILAAGPRLTPAVPVADDSVQLLNDPPGARVHLVNAGKVTPLRFL